MSWLEDVFGVRKPVIGMLHLLALPGDPSYDAQSGVTGVVTRARRELEALQAGGVDGVLISNEFSLPYLTRTEPITAITMSRVIGELLPDISRPFGVNVLWDAVASIDLAVATEAAFVREIFTGVYASDFGLWDTNVGATERHRKHVEGSGIRMLYNIVPESSKYLAERDLASITRTTVFTSKPDALCVSGAAAGAPTNSSTLSIVKDNADDTPVFVNTGVRPDSLEELLAIADGAIVGTYFKQEGVFANAVDRHRVADLMLVARQFRDGAARSGSSA